MISTGINPTSRIDESLKDVGLSKIKTKEEAISFLVTSYPGVKCHDSNQWVFYNDCIIELVSAFKISKAELKQAIKDGKELDKKVGDKP